MNRLSRAKRAKIIRLLVEGCSLRAISRVEDVSVNTVTRLLVEAGAACAEFHDKAVRSVRSRNVQLDEIWQFCYAKEKNVPSATAAPDWSGDAWTWTAIDSESKLIVSFVTGDRSATTAVAFLEDLKSRLADRIQLTSDGHGIYLVAVEKVFGDGVDFAQLVKLYGQPEGETSTESRYSPGECTGTKKKRVVGKSRSEPDQHVLCRAAKPDDANVHEAVHAAHKRILKEKSTTMRLRSRCTLCSTISAGFTKRSA